MRRIKQLITILVSLVLLLVIGIGIAVLTFDADKYRPQLVELLSKQTGRTISLGGPIQLGFASGGATLSIRDAAIGNPSWASRGEMAGIGTFELGIALLPLLNHQINITQLKIKNADILLEKASGNKNNWDLAPKQQADGKVAAKTTDTSTGKSISIHADHILITDSQVALRDENGKMTVFKTKELRYGMENGGLGIYFEGEYNDTPLTLKITTEAKDLSASGTWPFVANVTYANYSIKAQGKANADEKKAEIAAYEITAGSSTLHGKAVVAWGNRTVIKGNLLSEKLIPSNFKMAEDKSMGNGKETPDANTESKSRYVFSEKPLPLDGLKTADVDVDIQIVELDAGAATLKEVKSHLNISHGRLEMPFKAVLGQDAVAGTLKLNAAASPAQLAFTFLAPSLDIAKVLELGGADAFLSGQGNVEMDVTSSGNSMRAFASNMNGKMNIIANGGSISAGAAKNIASGLATLFAPNGTNTLNCLAARFEANNGLVRDKGILVDTAATTIAGTGGFNLASETIDLTLRAKQKLVNLGNIEPALHISGTLANPSYGLDSTAVVKSVVGLLTSGLQGNASSIPEIVKQPGQNACLYTLDHPAPQAQAAATPKEGVLVPGVGGQINKAKDIGNQLMKGLLGSQ
ncbi:MAG: AsmA family protein [Alphaproteobacteria bacterium]